MQHPVRELGEVKHMVIFAIGLTLGILVQQIFNRPKISYSVGELSTTFLIAKSPLRDFDTIEREFREEPDSTPEAHADAEILARTSMSMPKASWHGTRVNLSRYGTVRFSITGRQKHDYSICHVKILEGGLRTTHCVRLRDGEMRAIPLILAKANSPESPYVLVWPHGCH